MAVCSEIHTKHINTLCGQNVELLNVRTGGTYSNLSWVLKCSKAVHFAGQSISIFHTFIYHSHFGLCSVLCVIMKMTV